MQRNTLCALFVNTATLYPCYWQERRGRKQGGETADRGKGQWGDGSDLPPTQVPWTHPSEQARDAQSAPPHPVAHSQRPTALHVPCPEHALGHTGWLQSSPPHPWSQLHIVMPGPVERHVPCLEQPLGQ